MAGQSVTPAPRIGEEGLPAMLAALAVTGTAVALLIWWGSRNNTRQTPPRPTS